MSPANTNKSVVVRSIARLMKILGVNYPSDTPIVKPEQDIQLSEYKDTEFRNMPGMTGSTGVENTNTGSILSQLLGVAQSTSQWVKESESLKMLNPEIGASAAIMVGSILSPTDLQTDAVSVVVENTSLGTELEAKLSKKLTELFNDHLELGPKIAEWTEDALYGSGACGVMVLPARNISNLNTALDVDALQAGRDPYRDLADMKKGKGSQVRGSLEQLYSGESLGTMPSASMEQMMQAIDHDIIASVESKDGFSNLTQAEILSSTKEVKSKIINLMHNNTKHVVVYNNPDVMRHGATNLRNVSSKLANEIEKQFIFDKANPTYVVDTAVTTDGHEPAIIVVPTQAIVPVTIPGAPDKHLGYFILVDQWGTPLTDSFYDNTTMSGSRKLTESAVQATYGVPSGYKLKETLGSSQKCSATSDVFSVTLKHLLLSKLEEYGLNGSHLESHTAMSTCLFRALLEKKKCGLVFVPEPLMIYYCFKHRPDGTGMSLTENMRTLLALRTTLLISYIMGATENSIDNKIIEVALDEKNTNIEQQLDIIRNAYIEKKMMRFDNNPLTVQRDLIQKSLTIVPKNIRGLSDSIGVTTDHKSTGAVMPDDGLLEKLTSWAITGLEVPHSALNHTSENEYSRSVATMNLHFNNNVKRKQKIVKKHGTKLVRAYIKHSPIIRAAIEEILKTTATDDPNGAGMEAGGDIAEKTNIKESTKEVKTNTSSLSANMARVIMGAKMTLPSPKIVVDKAQFEEIEKYIGTLDKIVESVYNDDMFMGEAANYKDTIATIRAIVKSAMVRDYINNIGFQSSYNIPFVDDIDVRNAKDMFHCLANTKKGFDDFKKFVVEAAENGTQNESEDSGAGASNYDENTGSDTEDSGGKTDKSTPTDEEASKFDFDDFPPPPTF